MTKSGQQDGFYRWEEKDFESIPARKLRKGDELSYSRGSGEIGKYGAIVIKKVVSYDFDEEYDGTIEVSYVLPTGVPVASSRGNEVIVEWRGSLPVISVEQKFKPDQLVMIRAS